MFNDGSETDLTIVVEGERYDATPDGDLNGDGLNDTAIVETDDGSIAFTDTNADGQADLMTQLDADGDIVGMARFDEATGEWVHVDLDEDATAGRTMGPRMIGVDLPGGRHVDVGAATDDTDGDGVKDTVVTTDSDGDTIIITDADEDGTADYLTSIGADGDIAIAERTSDAEWTTIERGHLDEHGRYQRETAEESGWLAAPEAPAASDAATQDRVDDRTGHWLDR